MIKSVRCHVPMKMKDYIPSSNNTVLMLSSISFILLSYSLFLILLLFIYLFCEFFYNLILTFKYYNKTIRYDLYNIFYMYVKVYDNLILFWLILKSFSFQRKLLFRQNPNFFFLSHASRNEELLADPFQRAEISWRIQNCTVVNNFEFFLTKFIWTKYKNKIQKWQFFQLELLEVCSPMICRVDRMLRRQHLSSSWWNGEEKLTGSGCL